MCVQIDLSWDRTMDEGLHRWGKNILESTSYLLPLASKTIVTEWYAKPSRAPALICLPCCAFLACSKVRNLRLEFCNSADVLNYKLSIFGNFRHKSKVGARKGRQWACPIDSYLESADLQWSHSILTIFHKFLNLTYVTFIDIHSRWNVE